MKYLGLDYGSYNIGVAVSSADGAFAFAREVVANDAHGFAHLVELVKKEGIQAIVMGDTRAYTGGENPITAEAEDFAERLGQATDLTVRLVHEAWSSFEAARYAPDKHHDDSVAAAVILQRYIDMHAGDGKVEKTE